MIADTRTNASLDNISTFRKLHVFDVPANAPYWRLPATSPSRNR